MSLALCPCDARDRKIKIVKIFCVFVKYALLFLKHKAIFSLKELLSNVFLFYYVAIFYTFVLSFQPYTCITVYAWCCKVALDLFV